MSEALAFDTPRFVKHLTENGFTEKQAEALAVEQVKLLDSQLATKADMTPIQRDIETLRQETRANIEALRQETRANIETLRQETRANIEALKSDLLKCLFGALVAQSGLIVALVKLL